MLITMPSRSSTPVKLGRSILAHANFNATHSSGFGSDAEGVPTRQRKKASKRSWASLGLRYGSGLQVLALFVNVSAPSTPRTVANIP